MTDRVDAFTSVAHYGFHLQPILDALPEHLRGQVYAPRTVDAEVRAFGMPCESALIPNSSAPLLVAGYQDLRFSRRPKVYCAHGAQQTYLLPDGSPLESGSFAGGPGHEGAAMFLYPSQRSCDLEFARYPTKYAVAVGAPKLDAWQKIPNPRNGVVAVTFHWDQHASSQVPEAGWAWPEWRDAIESLSQRREVIGTCHPRAKRDIAPWYKSVGIEYVEKFSDLLPRAEILVLDNSSAGWEWTALDRPTVWLRGRDWTDTRHGLRFGDPLPGPEIGLIPGWGFVDADDQCRALDYYLGAPDAKPLPWYEKRALDPWWATRRAWSTRRVYGGPLNGNAAARAAAAIMERFGLA